MHPGAARFGKLLAISSQKQTGTVSTESLQPPENGNVYVSRAKRNAFPLKKKTCKIGPDYPRGANRHTLLKVDTFKSPELLCHFLVTFKHPF